MLNKTISDLIYSHFVWLDNFGINHRTKVRQQLDFLRFYVPLEKRLLYWTPRDWWNVRDNPNLVPTWFDRVFSMTDPKYSLWVYQIDWFAPTSVLRWARVRVKIEWVVQDLVEVCIYWKALCLYYSWHLSWLKDFVIRYGWLCTRADVCFDFNCEIPWSEYPWDFYVDLKRSWVKFNSNWGVWTIYYWKKTSPCFIRIYDKTDDLRSEKNVHAFMYPKWYVEKCWRVEYEFKWRYAKLATPIEWLESQSRDFKITPIEQTKRNNYKTLLYSAVNCVDIINYSDGEKIIILQNAKELINNKLKNLYHNT